MTRKLRSPAFTKGFTKGFCSPYLFLFAPHTRIRPTYGDVSVRAWRDTGKDLEEATEVEMSKVVQNYSKQNTGNGRRTKLPA